MEQHFSKIKQRILQYADYYKYSKRKIYADTGIANGVLDKSTGLTEDNIEKFISTYKEVSPEWLLTGNGEMLKGNNQPISLVEESKPLYTARKQPDDIVDRLLNRLEQQSEEIGKLKTELELYKRGDVPGAQGAGVAVAN